MVSSKKDVVVVGASVAGLLAAGRLAESGVPVRVFEARGELQPERRTLIVTPACLRFLDFNVEQAVLNRTRTFELISKGASARVELREPDLVLERACLMHLLLQRAQAAGAEVVFGQRFEGLEQESVLPLLRLWNGRGPEHEEAATIIGADGPASSVARAVNRAGVQTVAIAQARVVLPGDLGRHTVRCWFDRASTRFFYWLIPESDQTGVLGLIAERADQAQSALQQFLRARDMEPLELQQAPVAMYTPGREAALEVGAGRVLWVGDAAGQVKVTTVGGVVTGMRGGAAAARSIIHRTSYGAEARGLRRELRAHAGLRYMLDGFEDADYDRLLRSLNRRTQRVLQCYSRDELGRSLWRLVLANPRWVTLGARGFLRALGSGCHISRGRAGRRDSAGGL